MHARVIEEMGGSFGVRDTGALESAIAQPRATFDGKDLYPSILEKAAALCYSLSLNHPFVDGNKRVAHAAMEVFLILNGFEINCSIDESERVMLNLAAGKSEREKLIAWLRKHAFPIE